MKKKKLIGIFIIVLFIIGGGIFVFLHNGQKANQQGNNDKQETVQDDVKEGTQGNQNSDTKDKVQNDEKTNTKDGASESSDIRSWFEEEKEIPKQKDEKFPYQIPNSSLSIRAVKSYSGVFIEDGSDKDVSGIAAIILDNKGTEHIEYVKITLKCEGKEYVFEAKTMAAGATMVVQESTGAKYVDGEYGEATAMVAAMEKLEMSEQLVKVKETESGGIEITNISGKDIPCVRIFYKFYIEDLDVLVGGITYTSKITDLQANEVRVITPSHYDKDASRVMMVRTYDTY